MTTRSILIGIGLAALFVLSWKVLRPSRIGGGADTRGLQVLWEAPDFELTDQNGKAFRKGDLLGKVWVADFIFTRCPGPCPRMTRQLHALQQRIPESDPVHFVSISIDPEYDTPQVLAQYADHYEVDQGRWHFLTGPADETIQLVVKGFFTAVQRGRPAGSDEPLNPSQIVHGTHFLLVDAQGRVRGSYDSNDQGVEERLFEDIRLLIAGTGKE